MNKLIAILRGINVGGKRKIIMTDLKELFHGLGFENVVTYIQSGNVIFSDKSDAPDSEIARKIESAISNKYGFDVPVIIRSAAQLEQAVLRNKFYQQDKIDTAQLHLTFLQAIPNPENSLKLETIKHEPDKYMLDGENVYIVCEGKYHESKLTNNFFENILKVPATTRNWNTILKLWELSKIDEFE